jgi:hypothetical protein
MKKFFNGIKDFLSESLKGFTGLFSEVSPTSLMRFMSFFLFWFSLYETHYIVAKYGKDLNSNQILLILILFSFSFFPKVVQKIIEKKYDALEKQATASLKSNKNNIEENV